MKATTGMKAVGVTLLLMTGGSAALAGPEAGAGAAPAVDRGIEKSDIRRGMRAKGEPADHGRRPGDPVPGTGIRHAPGSLVCANGSTNCPPEDSAATAGRKEAKFKAGKALADTVKRVDDSGNGSGAVVSDSDGDGRPER